MRVGSWRRGRGRKVRVETSVKGGRRRGGKPLRGRRRKPVRGRRRRRRRRRRKKDSSTVPSTGLRCTMLCSILH